MNNSKFTLKIIAGLFLGNKKVQLTEPSQRGDGQHVCHGKSV